MSAAFWRYCVCGRVLQCRQCKHIFGDCECVGRTVCGGEAWCTVCGVNTLEATGLRCKLTPWDLQKCVAAGELDVLVVEIKRDETREWRRLAELARAAGRTVVCELFTSLADELEPTTPPSDAPPVKPDEA